MRDFYVAILAMTPQTISDDNLKQKSDRQKISLCLDQDKKQAIYWQFIPFSIEDNEPIESWPVDVSVFKRISDGWEFGQKFSSPSLVDKFGKRHKTKPFGIVSTFTVSETCFMVIFVFLSSQCNPSDAPTPFEI